MDVADINVIDGGWQAEDPVVVLDAGTARHAIREGELLQLVEAALDALFLSGKNVVIVKDAES